MQIEDITLAEMAEVEKIADAPIAWLSDDNKPKAKLLQALNFVITRRDNPDFTMDEAGKTPLKKIYEMLGEEEKK
jgi:hypothetical protein